MVRSACTFTFTDAPNGVSRLFFLRHEFLIGAVTYSVTRSLLQRQLTLTDLIYCRDNLRGHLVYIHHLPHPFAPSSLLPLTRMQHDDSILRDIRRSFDQRNYLSRERWIFRCCPTHLPLKPLFPVSALLLAFFDYLWFFKSEYKVIWP